MTDTLTTKQRSQRMSLIRGKNSAAELALRSLVHRMGYRYRLHGRSLPGKPDLVFTSRRAVIFMHGCFWHRHPDCRFARLPKSRLEFWVPKLEANRVRDRANEVKLAELGWRTLVIWECEMRSTELVEEKVRLFLGPPGKVK